MAVDNRLLGADFVRASACCIVLAHHLAQRVDGGSALGRQPLVHMFNIVGGFGVAMFFVLSGFLLARPFWQAMDRGEPMPSLRIYALRRLARIVPGFWLALTVSFVLSFAVFGFKLNIWLVWRYVAGLLLISDWHWTTYFPVEIDGPLWSIGMEASSYVMLPLGFWALFALGRGRLQGWPARLAWLGVIVAALAAHWLFVNLVQVSPVKRGWNNGLQGGAKVWMPWFNPFGFFAMFAIGALAAGVQLMLARSRSVVFDLGAVAGIALAGWLLWQYGLTEPSDFYGLLRIPYDYPIYHIVVGIILALLPSTVLVGRLLDNPVVAFVAKISFGLYVWHYIVLELARLYWLPDIAQGMMERPDRFALGSAVILGITGVIAALSYRWLEKPVIDWARSLEKP
ncbi:acyltransferase family protein [uncultured Devosia sp.]|uniref:acyltransferase family protein n=1 Tax=uncultured Devosia sp. TaxID=211434 RepID=UPI0035CB99DF